MVHYDPLLLSTDTLVRRIDELVRITRPAVLHVHSPVLNALPALWVGRRRKIPVVYEVRAFWEDAAVDHGTSSEGGLRYRATRSVGSAPFAIQAFTLSRSSLSRSVLSFGSSGLK